GPGASGSGSSGSRASEQSLRAGRRLDHAGGGLDGEPAELAGGQVGELCGGVEEAVDLLGFDEALGEGAELVLVLLAAEGPGAERVGVRHGDAVLDHGAVGEGDDHGAAEGL